jgi:hypothetical protein
VTEVRIILDTTAILAYAAGSIHVGEVLAEVADEPAQFAVPLGCLIEAAQRASPELLAGVHLLTAHRHGVVLPDRVDRWRALAGLARVVGRVDLAVALVAAQEYSAHVLTAEPDAYGEPGKSVVIGI